MKAEVSVDDVTDGRSSRWQSHRETRRDQLIADSRKIIHRLGPDASMDDIAQAAGTSKSVFYRYFGDKAGLQTAVGDLVIVDIQAALSDALTSAGGAREGILAMVSAYLHMAEASPNVYAFVTGPSAGRTVGINEFSGFFSTIARMLVAALPDGFRAGLGTSDGATSELGTSGLVSSGMADAWALSAIGMVRFSGEWWMARRGRASSDPVGGDAADVPSRDEMAHRIASWLWSGLDHELRNEK